MPTRELLILPAEAVREALPMRAAIGAMRSAFTALSDGRATLPARTHLSLTDPAGTALFMPSYLASLRAIGIKTVTLFPDNRAHGLPLLQGLFCLFDAERGSPQALLDAAALTALRTGAVSGLATELLARPTAERVAVLGAGVQGRTQLSAVCSVRPIRQATVFDVDATAAARFARQMAAELAIPVTVAASAADAIGRADIVCTATVASRPVFEDRHLPAACHVNAVGSYQPAVQEIPAETVQRARVVVDHRESALAETGDLIVPLKQGLISVDHIAAQLGDVLTGKAVGRRAPDETTLFKSVGLAIQDLAAAHVTVERARRLGLGTAVTI